VLSGVCRGLCLVPLEVAVDHRRHVATLACSAGGLAPSARVSA
jgi:hypothetical protein